MYKCIFFDDPAKLLPLCAILDNDSSLAWWTKRIHVARYHAECDASTDDIENALVSIVRHCSNLEIFIYDWPMGPTIGPVADALATYCAKTLRTVHWNVPSEAVAKVIWALASLPLIVTAHIEFSTPQSETLHLGSASDLRLTLPNLQQLSLSGCFQEFLEQATGWRIPALKSFSFDGGTSQVDQPDVVAFLAQHGASLIFLDLFCIPALDVAKILELCPLLKTFIFNADWRLPPTSNEFLGAVTAMVNYPHDNITQIGCHGLLSALGVSYVATYTSMEPLHSHMMRMTNDKNFAALNRTNFPALQCVRALSRTMLSDLNAADGPDPTCYERWERWWNQCTSQGVRLEDCTGNELGFLPEDSGEADDEDDSEDEEGNYDSDSFEVEQDEDGMGFKFVIPRKGDDSPVNELKQLLEECRKMTAGRDEDLLPPPSDWQ